MKMKTKNIFLIIIALIVLAIVIVKIIPMIKSYIKPSVSSTVAVVPATNEKYYRMKEQFRFYRRIQLQVIKKQMQEKIDIISEWISKNVGKVKALFDGLGIKLCDLVDKSETELLDWFDTKGTAFLDKIFKKIIGLPVVGEKIQVIVLKYEEENDVDLRDVIIGFLSAFVTDEMFNQGSRVRTMLRCK
jgi:hypothetical protein